MKEIIIYIVEAIVCLTVMMLVYRFWLSSKSPFGFQRAYLIISTILAAIIPLLRIPLFSPSIGGETGLAELSPIFMVTDNIVVFPKQSGLEADSIIFILYVCMVAIGISTLVYNSYRIKTIRKGAEKSNIGNITIYTSPKITSPFAYFNSIYINSEFSYSERRQIIAHEMSHITHRHPKERIIMNVICVLSFFNPLSWYAARKLSEVHEYETDRDVLDKGYDLTEYRKLILKQLLGYCPEITSGLNNSLTKKRFIMMTINKKPGNAIVHAIVSICVIAVLILSFGCGEKKTLAPIPEITAAPETVIESEADTTEATLTNEAQNDSDVAEINKTEPVEKSLSFLVPDVVEKPKVKDSGIPAQFPGGDQALYQFMSDNLRYPQSAVDEGIKGVVAVSFTVNKDGSISDIEILKSLDPDCDKAVIETIENMPKWIPAKQDGLEIDSTFVLPITFEGHKSMQ